MVDRPPKNERKQSPVRGGRPPGGPRRRAPHRPAALLLALAVGLGAIAGPARAQTYWSRAKLLRSFFASCDRVTCKRLPVDARTAERLRKRLGRKPPSSVRLYYGLRAGVVRGVALIDHELGQHRPITFAVRFGRNGAVSRVELVAYREPRGGEIRSPRFRAQFRGKRSTDRLRLGEDIDAISGATISSRAMTIGVRRALAEVDELVMRPGIDRVLAPRAAPTATKR